MASREEVRWAYLMLLGREPESEEAYATHCSHRDVATLRATLLRSVEGFNRIRFDLRSAMELLPFEYRQPLTVHLHIEKTGGTFLYEALSSAYRDRTISLPHTTHLQCYSLGELNQFDFVSGHLTLGEALALPRSPKTLISVFREPHARLMSFYRFHRAHPRNVGEDPMMDLARTLDPVAFFEADEVRSSHRLFNAYVRLLAGLPDASKAWTPERMMRSTHDAIDHLESLSVIGITENMTEAVEQMRRVTGLPFVDPGAPIHSTDAVSRRPGFTRVPDFPLTDDVRRAMRPLIEYDGVIYDAAKRLSAERAAPQALAPPPDTWLRRIRNASLLTR